MLSLLEFHLRNNFENFLPMSMIFAAHIGSLVIYDALKNACNNQHWLVVWNMTLVFAFNLGAVDLSICGEI